jgi:hypothetical protein
LGVKLEIEIKKKTPRKSKPLWQEERTNEVFEKYFGDIGNSRTDFGDHSTILGWRALWALLRPWPPLQQSLALGWH